MMIILKVWSYFFIIWSIIDKNLEKDQIIFEVRYNKWESLLLMNEKLKRKRSNFIKSINKYNKLLMVKILKDKLEIETSFSSSSIDHSEELTNRF